MVQFRKEGHLSTELEQPFLCELLLDESFHCHIYALPLAAENKAVAACADL